MIRLKEQEQFSEKGRELYYKLKSQLEKEYEADDVVLIEPETGDYFVADTTIEAYKNARKTYPDKKFFVAQVGRLASSLK